MCDKDLGEYPEERECRPFTIEKMVGVGLAGAVASLVMYYFYHQLNKETRKLLKENLVVAVKSQLKKIGEN